MSQQRRAGKALSYLPPLAPNLPTFNLYKFVALAGLALTVLSVALPTVQRNAVAEKIDQLRVDTAVMEAEQQNVLKDIELAKRLADAGREMPGLSQRINEGRCDLRP